MDFIKNIFNFSKDYSTQTFENAENKHLSVDEVFVQKFIQKKGRFLYCLDQQEVFDNLRRIALENNWNIFNSVDKSVLSDLKQTNFTVKNNFIPSLPILVSCEFLIAENGGILLSSNQLKDHKIANLSDDFIVFARTSQIVRTKDASLRGINTKYKDQLPSNISPIINFKEGIGKQNDFLHHGSSCAKNVYLLLLEDL
jgi:L-lactate utilization protein LutC